jgi:hypothetical protein
MNSFRRAARGAALALFAAALTAILGCSPTVASPESTKRPTGSPAQPSAGRAAVRKPSSARPKRTASTRPAKKEPADENTAALAHQRREQSGVLEDLLKQGLAQQYELPKLDEEKIAAAGLRKLSGRYIELYTDLPAAADVEELPRVFDAAVPLWCEYFHVEPATVAAWKIVGSVMQAKERFVSAGLYTPDLPPFPAGLNRRSELWLYEQKSPYYRRHLLLHEGTHSFMERWLGGTGPPWYAEGMAELLGTHRWQDGQLTLGIMPRSKEEVPYHGRVKIIRDEYAAKRGMSLLDILQYGSQVHLQIDELKAYGWCWGAAEFFDAHPLTQAVFRAMKSEAKDISLSFSERFYERLKEHWPEISEDWQIYVADCDYGYDVARAAVVRKPAVALPPGGASVRLATDRGWQSTGYRLSAGKSYMLTASGRYNIATSPKPWPCEAGGVTIRYANGLPLGMLVAGLGDLEGDRPLLTPLTNPQSIGLGGEIEPTTTGTLYLKINAPAADLADNTGTLSVRIQPKN